MAVAELEKPVKPIINLIKEETVSIVVTSEPRARSRTFTAKPCAACAALREPDTNFTRVFATRGNVRYCRCHYCGNTWKDSDAVPHNGS
jgi:aspartate carbamoyltransferase regulatory subunit